MLTPPHSTPGSEPDRRSLLTSNALLLSIRLTQEDGIVPLILLLLMLNLSNSAVVLPHASGSPPDSLLLLRSKENTCPGPNAARRPGGRVPGVVVGQVCVCTSTRWREGLSSR